MVSDRARQFMPFSALKGFHKLILEKERVIVSKKELSEDETEEISRKLSRMEKGMMAEITYFCSGEYVKLEGVVTNVDFTFRNLTVVKTKIDFDNISEISISQDLTK